MNTVGIGNSYNKTLYDVGESIKSDKSVPVKMGAVSQDMYVHSKEESSYVTYTPNGRVNGEDVFKNESKQLNILPERYKESSLSGKVYYQGKLITYYELIQIAVETGAISLDESETVGWNMLNAENSLIDSKATPLYDWSTTLYSEDGMYVYRVENGNITGARSTMFSDGTTLQDFANEIASGTPLSELDRYKLHDLMLYDMELYDTAVNIGTAKREYDTFIDMYHNGQLTEKHFKHDCYPLLLLLFGKDADTNNRNQFLQLSSFFGQDREEFLKNAFANYNPSNQFLADKLLIEKEYRSYSGIY